MAITFHYEAGSLQTDNRSGCNLLQLAQEAGVHIEARCGGQGACGSCMVVLGAGRYRVCGEIVEVPPRQRREALACQSFVLGAEAEIHILQRSLISTESSRISESFQLPRFDRQPRFATGYGVAVDIGTTTVVAVLVRLDSGEILSCKSMYNQQILKADDVISRISLCSEPAGLKTLQQLVIDHTLNPLISQLCADGAVEPHEIVHLCVAGNTVMLHIFYALSPVSIGVLPFTPLQRCFESTAEKLGIAIKPSAPVEAVPAVSGYIGGDITADMQLSGLTKRRGCALLVDIGTNGEIAFWDGSQITACATAAGPAFEGAGIMCGTRAVSGAIDTIDFEGSLDFKLSVIGLGEPIGLCGSAVIDFIAAGFRCGLINMMGRFDIELLRAHGRYTSVNGAHACVIHRTQDSDETADIVITERDIAEILKAKAAIYSGIKTLLTEATRTVHDLEVVILAGGFASYINLNNAFEIGLLPTLGIDRYEIIGNGSLAGAIALLLNRQLADDYRLLIDQPHVVHLNRTAKFTEYYQDAVVIPNLCPE
jgi:uncharacterized 2Fe-2S/4Fe-4S cluster protein (DUF4445 family)